jgi:radical SAM protein with 4Fe4S-binding SPASM domain
MLAPERVAHLVDEFADGGGRDITFTGGEPLVYPDLHSLVRHCHARQLRVRLFSSGVVGRTAEPQPVSIATLHELAPFVAGIDYSVYAAQAPAHDNITGVDGSLDATTEAIRRTVAAGIGAMIHFVPTSSNYQTFPTVVALAAELGVARVGVLRFVPHGRGKRRGPSLVLDAGAHTWLRVAIMNLQTQYPQVQINVGSAYNLLDIGPLKPCRAGIDQLVVFADGSIAPCSAFGNVASQDDLSNILQYSLRDVWNHSPYLARVRTALAAKPDCRGCLAQKTIQAGRVDAFAPDPLHQILASQHQAPTEGDGNGIT